MPRRSQKPKHLECLLAYRYITAILMCVGCITAFVLYQSFHKALPYLKASKASFSKPKYNLRCNFTRIVNERIPVEKIQYRWKPETYNLIKYAHSWGYLLISLSSGVVSDKYGGKYVLCVPILVLSMIHLLAPYLRSGGDGDFYLFFIWNGLIGIGFSAMFPSMNSILAQWTPQRDRGKLSSMVYSGTQFAVTFHHLITHNVIHAAKMWNAAILMYSGCATVWTVFFLFFGFSSYRNKNRWLTQKELNYLKEELEDETNFVTKKIPWLRLLTSIPLWALTIAHVGHVWIWLVMIKNVPFYLKSMLYFDNDTADLYSALIFMILGSFTVLDGFIADYLTNREYVHLTTLRRVYTTLGAMGPTIFLLAASYSGCHRNITVFLLTLGMMFMSFYYGGTRINTLELAPNFSGTIMGFINSFNIIPSTLLPKLTAAIAPHYTSDEIRNLFWIHLGVVSISNIVYTSLGTTDIQWWNYVDDEVEGERAEGQGSQPDVPEDI